VVRGKAQCLSWSLASINAARTEFSVGTGTRTASICGHIDFSIAYMRSRTHLALGKDTALTRPVSPPLDGRIVATPEVGGLHHRYDRIAAWPSPRRRSQLQPGLHHPCVERFAVAVRCCGRSHSRRYRLPRTARNYARVPEAASNHLHCLRIDFSTVTGAYTIGYGSRYANREWQHHSSPM
jgi:hypothetical protein